MGTLWKAFLCCCVFATVLQVEGKTGSFVIDYQNNQFVKDGQPFRYISGSLHFFRVPRVYWPDRLAKMIAAGLNAVQTYVDWSQHEPYPGQYNFDDNLDLVAFLKLAQKMGLLVVLRPGPYIDAERDMGGLPFWLLQTNPKMVLRSNDPTYIKYVDKFFNKLLPMLRPLLYENGGPIISMQVENEYGSHYTCDFNYMVHLRDLFRAQLGNNVVLFTTDGNADSFLKCGKTQGLYATIDFGPGTDVNASFTAQRNHEPHGPLVNSEYYPGWLDHWAYPHAAPSVDLTVKTLHEILAANASVNMYMFHGGTNFGFTNGAFQYDTFVPSHTSYDSGAPMSEAGDTVDLYFKIREVIKKYTKMPLQPVPPPVPKYKYGTVNLKPIGSLFQLLPLLRSSPPITSQYPLTFEQLGQAYGFVLYETTTKALVMDPSYLTVTGIKDRGIVFVDEVPVGILSRQDSLTSLPITILKGQKLSILVENQGRVCYGAGILDLKGILSNVTLGSQTLTNWTNTPVPLNNTDKLEKLMQKFSHSKRKVFGSTMPLVPNGNYYTPGLFTGEFVVPNNASFPLDTFLRMDGWYKGVAFVNNFNIGRYWPIVGPQVTLYIPKSVLKPYPAPNYILMVELEKAPCGNNDDACTVYLDDTPKLDGPTPHDGTGQQLFQMKMHG